MTSRLEIFWSQTLPHITQVTSSKSFLICSNYLCPNLIYENGVFHLTYSRRNQQQFVTTKFSSTSPYTTCFWSFIYRKREYRKTPLAVDLIRHVIIINASDVMRLHSCRVSWVKAFPRECPPFLQHLRGRFHLSWLLGPSSCGVSPKEPSWKISTLTGPCWWWVGRHTITLKIS